MTEPPLHPQDLHLAQRALGGDPVARRQFASRMTCIPGVLKARNARMGYPLKPEDLADLVQDTVAAVWKKLGDYSGQATLESWAFQFCVFEMLSALRKRRRHRAVLEGISAEESRDELAETAALDEPKPSDFEDLYAGMSQLPGAELEVIRLKHFDQLTFEEIATKIGSSPNTAKTRYYRALSRLRDALGPQREEEAS